MNQKNIGITMKKVVINNETSFYEIKIITQKIGLAPNLTWCIILLLKNPMINL